MVILHEHINNSQILTRSLTYILLLPLGVFSLSFLLDFCFLSLFIF